MSRTVGDRMTRAVLIVLALTLLARNMPQHQPPPPPGCYRGHCGAEGRAA